MKKKPTNDFTVHKDYFKSTSVNLHEGRYRWIINALLKSVKKKTILEIGCGDGGLINYLKTDNTVTGIDIAESGVKNLKKLGMKAYIVDASKDVFPFKDHTFDYVIIFEAFEHLKCPQNAVEEIQRVLKKDGTMLASIPNPRGGHKYLYPSLFKFGNFAEYFKINGFTITRTVPYGVCLPIFWKIYWKFFPLKDAAPVKAKPTATTQTNKLALFSQMLNSEFVTNLKPHWLAGLLIYEAKNTDPNGAKKLYARIAHETSGAY